MKLKINWSIIWHNFNQQKIKLLISNAIFFLYFTLALLIPHLSPNDTPREQLRYSNVAIWAVMIFFTFIEVRILIKHIVYKKIINNTDESILMSKYNKNDLLVIKLVNIFTYVLIKLLIIIIWSSIELSIESDLNIGKTLWLEFNVYIGLIPIFLLMILLAYKFFDSRKKILLIYTIAIFAFYILMLISSLTMDIEDRNSKTKIFLKVISYIPFIGMGGPVWFISNSWQQYLNLPISIVSSVFLIYGIFKINKKITY